MALGPPTYRSPANIVVPSQVTSIAWADFTLAAASTPLPVIASAAVDGDYSKVPIYLDPYGAQVPANPYSILLADGSFVGPGNPLPTTGGGGGVVAASDVTVTNAGFSNAQEIFDFLLYVPLQITAFTGGSNNEIGSTVANIALDWTYNKAVTSQSLNQGIGAVTVAQRFWDIPGANITSNITYTLSATDGTTPRTANASVSFFPKRYWGPWPDQSPDNAEVLTLSQELASGRGKAITYDCTGGRFPLYVYPKSFGLITGVTVGNLPFSDYSHDELSITNASGYTQDYYRYFFNGIQTGAAIAVVWS